MLNIVRMYKFTFYQVVNTAQKKKVSLYDCFTNYGKQVSLTMIESSTLYSVEYFKIVVDGTRLK